MILFPEMKDDGFPSSYFRLFAFAFLDEYNLSNIFPHYFFHSLFNTIHGNQLHSLVYQIYSVFRNGHSVEIRKKSHSFEANVGQMRMKVLWGAALNAYLFGDSSVMLAYS